MRADALDLLLEIIPTAASSCRLFTTPRLGRRQAAAALPDRYVQRRRGRIDVDLAAAGIRKDVDFWRSLMNQGGYAPLFTVSLSRISPGVLVASPEGPIFATLRYHLPATALRFARAQTARGNTVVLALAKMGLAVFPGPHGEETGLELVVFAKPKLAARLAATAVERVGRRDTMVLPKLLSLAYHLHWNVNIESAGGGDPEKRLRAHLTRAAKRRRDWQVARRAAAAAELVAIAEGRGPDTRDDWPELAREHYAELRTWAAEQDLLGAETVTLARSAARALSPARLIDPTLITAPAKAAERAEWRESLSDVVRRLDAAILGRKVRAQAPNARPPAATKRVIEELVEPKRWAGLRFYALRDDAQALCDFLREETGASLAVKNTTGGLHELKSAYDTIQLLGEAFAGSFDTRKLSFPEKRRGFAILVWWPAISPGPVVRERRPRPEDAEEDAMLRELTVSQRPPRPRFEVVGWGYTQLLFRGGCEDPKERLVLRSAWEYPAEKELERPRYQGAGPWRDVDWPALRRAIRRVRAELQGPLAGGRTAGSRPEPVLSTAFARVQEGWRLANKYGMSGHVKLA